MIPTVDKGKKPIHPQYYSLFHVLLRLLMPTFLIRSNKKTKMLVESSDGNDVDDAGTDDAEDDSDNKDVDSSDAEAVEDKAEINKK